MFNLINKKISLQKRQIELLKSYKRGLINHIFEENFDILKGAGWQDYKLSEILKERKIYSEKDGTYEHATLSKDGVSGKTERYDRDFLVASNDKKYKITKLGDICYNPANLKFGVICLNTYGDAIFSPIYVTFEVNSNFNKEFIGLCLTRNNFINKALQYQQGTVYERMAVSPEDLLSMHVKLPPKYIQDKLSKMVLLYNCELLKAEDSLSYLLQLKNKLLREMFI